MIHIPFIDVYLTGKCNYLCSYCYGENSKAPDMSLDTFKQVINFAQEIGSGISFTGGEPLLHKNISLLTRLARNSGIPLHLRTNGIFLKEYAELIKEFKWIGVSIDGTIDVNDRMRPFSGKYIINKHDKFFKPMQSIDLIKEADTDTKVLLATLVSKQNIEDLVDLSTYLSDNKVPFDIWKLYGFTSNNFRSLKTKSIHNVSNERLISIQKRIEIQHKGKVIFKPGVGNCLLVTTEGNLRMNNLLIGSIYDKKDDVFAKLEITGIEQIFINKTRTFSS